MINRRSLLLVGLLALVVGGGFGWWLRGTLTEEVIESPSASVDQIELTITDRWWITNTHKTELVSREVWNNRLNAFHIQTMRLPRETRENMGFFGESIAYPDDFPLTGLDPEIWTNGYTVTYFASLIDSDGNLYYDEISAGREDVYWSQSDIETVSCRQLDIGNEVRDCVRIQPLGG